MSQSDKRLDRCTPASELVDLSAYEKRVFRMVRNNELTVVRLDKVKRRDVYLEYVQGDRQDGFTMSHAEFRKFYHLVNVRPVEVK